MLQILKIVRRIIEGSVLAFVILGVVAALGASETVNLLIAERSANSILFLVMTGVVFADLLAKIIGILDTTFPDLLPKFDDEDMKRASLISRLRPGQTMAILSGAYVARIILFVAMFALLGVTYASTSDAVQARLFGDFGAGQAFGAFLREGVAGSIGYFLFFLGPDDLEPLTGAVSSERLDARSLDGDIFLAGIRLYGLAFVLAVLRTLATPISFARARMRAGRLVGEGDAT